MDSSRVAIVAGYGTGISAAVARKLGSEGYKLALLARTQARLDAAVEELSKSGIIAKGYTADLSQPAAVTAAVAAAQQDLGPINLLHWNPLSVHLASITGLTPEQMQHPFNVSVTGLLAAVQAALPDLKATQGAVLVTGGGFALEQDTYTQMAVDWNATSLAVAKAAQRKLVHILHTGLAADGIYVAEVTVVGAVRGTTADPEGKSNLTAEAVAEEFWTLARKRDHAVWFVVKE